MITLRQTLAATFVVALSVIAAPAQTPPAAAPSDGTQQFAQLGQCRLTSGEAITDCRLGYRTWGHLNADNSNAILFPTWFTGNSGELAESFSPDGLADPARYFIIAVDALADGVSSSPSNSKSQPRMTFPAVTIQDMVSAEYRLVTETLHLKHLHAVMGISMGGMQTFEWLADYPSFFDVAIPIVGSTRLTSYDLTLWHAEEDAIRATPAWQQGNYAKSPAVPLTAILHDINLTTPTRYNQLVPRDKFAAQYASYGTEGATDFDANDRIYQLQAMIHHDIAHGGSLEDLARHLLTIPHPRVLIVVSRQDHMVNPAPALDFAPLIGAKTLVLDTPCGHLGPGCEAATVNPAVRAFLDGK